MLRANSNKVIIINKTKRKKIKIINKNNKKIINNNSKNRVNKYPNEKEEERKDAQLKDSQHMSRKKYHSNFK